MPRPPEVTDFAEADLDAAASMLAARHRADRARFPILPARFEEPEACLEVLRAATRYGEGVAARRDGRLAGFMFAVDNVPSPSSPSARYAPERGSVMLAHAHAVRSDEDAADVYHALYATLAERWLRRGIFDHTAHVPAGNPALDAAWADLGFGRSSAVAARDLAPVPADRLDASVEVRRAGPEDLDVVGRLVDEEARYHARSPILRPYLSRETARAVRESHREALADGSQAIFLGCVGGEETGITWIGPPRGSPLFTPEDAAYIGDTAVVEQARGAGVGAALVDAALAWAREQGYRAVTLHYSPANALSRAFWPGLGFQPVMWHLRRRLEERIAWAQPE